MTHKRMTAADYLAKARHARANGLSVDGWLALSRVALEREQREQERHARMFRNVLASLTA